MALRPELVSQEVTCGMDTVACAREDVFEGRGLYRFLATGFSYLFSTAFVSVFLAMGFAAVVTIVTILVGVLGGFN